MNENEYKNIAIITGASSGIGREFVDKICNRKKKFYEEIWLVARRTERLEELKNKYPKQSFKIISLDLEKKKSYSELSDLLEKEKVSIRLLVNNAGFGKYGAFTEISLEDQIGMINVNVKGFTAVAYIALKYMYKGSQMINTASSAGFVPQPGFNVYSATKAYAVSFSRALRREVSERGIKVLTVCPGPVKTEFFDNIGDVSDYKKKIYVGPKDVVNQAYRDIRKGKELSVAGFWMKIFMVFMQVIPANLLLKAMKIVEDRSGK